MKKAALLAVFLAAVQLIASTVDFPSWGDFRSPACIHLSKDFIERCQKETETPNIVTAILADYRSFDTMLETFVVFIAALACFLILREPLKKSAPPASSCRYSSSSPAAPIPSACTTSEDGSLHRIDSDWTPPSVVVVTVSRMIMPFIQLFGLYVLAHGHYSPGGGFQAGVIFAASYILLAVSHDLGTLVSHLTEKAGHLFLAAGMLIFFGVGLIGLVGGGAFLDYGVLGKFLGMALPSSHSLGILLVEVGVSLTVTTSMIIIFKLLSSKGTVTEGL